MQVISGLDEPICVNCGCNDVRFLEINHINGGGREEFRNRKNLLVYNDIVQGRRTTKDLNILCRVCNALDDLKRRFGEVSITVNWG